MSRWRNSIHIAIRWWDRCVILRSASVASDECENVQHRSNIADVPRNAHNLSDAGMFVRQGLKAFAHVPQLVSFQQDILERPEVVRAHCEFARSCRVQLRFDLNLKGYTFYQTQRCRFAKKSKKKSEQLRNQNDSDLAILLCV